MIMTVAFYGFMLIAAISALGILVIKNVFKGALLLLICLLALAALYILLLAEFVAITQILIYAGGILVIILFGIMLTSKISGTPLRVKHGNIVAGIIAGVSICSLLIRLISDHFAATAQSPMQTSQAIETIGIHFMTDYIIPFEVAGILLLMALIGAAVTVSFMKTKKV